MLELLSPAGSPDAVIAAVQNGADAVYMGFGAHNARRSADNFTEDEFAKAVRYCHIRGCKVYVTLNTLVGDREMTAAADLARKASDYGADAILVQDLGLMRVLRDAVPDIPLHASTQMSIHTSRAWRPPPKWASPARCWRGSFRSTRFARFPNTRASRRRCSCTARCASAIPASAT